MGSGEVMTAFFCLWLRTACLFLGFSPGIALAIDWNKLDEASTLGIFFERNIDLIAAQYEIDRSLAIEWIQGALPNPVISFGLNELNGVMTGRPTEVGSQGLGYNIFLTQKMFMAGKRSLRMEGARFGREASEADFKDTVRWLANEVRHAFVDLALAQKALEVLRENMKTLDRITEANRLRERLGDIPLAELERIEVERLKALGELDLASSRVMAKKTELAKLLNWPDASMDIEVKEARFELPHALMNPKEGALFDEALAARADLLAQDLRIQQMTRELELARRLFIPDLTVSGGYLQDAGNLQMDTGAIMVSGEVPVLYQYGGEVGKALAALDAARNEREMLKNRIRKEVSTAMAALQAGMAVVSRFEEMVLPRLQKAKVGIEYSYDQGAAGLIDLLDAERNYKSMMLDYFSAQAERSLAYADLRSALGEEVHP